MAIYHLAMKPIARSSGRSAVAAAAYRAAQKLTNERDGLTHDFTRRGGVEHVEIVIPKGSDADWAKDRSTLWNMAEAAEKRKDARVAREIEVALPHELTADQRLALTREFAQSMADRYGVAVDFALHSPHGATDIRNHHAHILLTTRKVEKDGLGEKTDLERENRKLLALGLPTSHDQLREIRVDWEQRTNHHLALAGYDLRIDHRSHRDCGLEIEPTQHIGVHASQMERRGKAVDRHRQEADSARHNAKLICEQPQQALALITHEKSVFDRTDVAMVLHRYIDSPDDFQAAFAKAMASPVLVELCPEQRDESGRTMAAARYSTKEMIAVERQLADSTDRMAESRTFAVGQRNIERAIAARSFLAEEQRNAIRHVAGPERIAAVVGLAGAGKSTMLAAAREAWEADGYRVFGAALAGKAAEGLEESSGIASRTLASWERGWERGYDRLSSRDVLVVDEAGMVGSRQLSRVIAHADRAGAKLVLVGDPEQLQPIGPGAAFRAVTERAGVTELGQIRRQREDWQREASVDFGRQRTHEGLTAYAERGAIRFEDDIAAARRAIVKDVITDRDARPESSRLVLAHRKVDVRQLNEMIRAARQEQGELQNERAYQTAEGDRAFAAGDRILFKENNRDLGVKNGMLGTVERAEPGRLDVRLDAGRGPGRVVSVSMADYAAVDHGYAVTIHKAQGATVDRTFVLASGSMDRHLTYVGMTRHRDSVTLYAGRNEFADLAALSSRLSRAGLKETTLDYAQRRGIENAITVPDTLRQRLTQDWGLHQQPDASAPKRSIFDGLKLAVAKPAPEVGRAEGLPAAQQVPSPFDIGSKDLAQAAERYARAWEDQQRMRDQTLPILEYQKRELREAAAALETVQPGAVNDLHNAMRYEPSTFRAMKQLRGPERGAELAGAIRHEDRVRRDPTLKAERLVKEWKRLEVQHERLGSGYAFDKARGKLESRMESLAREFKRDPQLESLVRARIKSLGIDMDSTLRRVLEAPSLGAAMREIGRGRGLSL
ncbi:MAG: Ti-type conjugative transfer relaxase TraA [Alphaproteobacteria bacterium]|nr:Ti-type conjugative transfer relaxase TraA [Alphaproteobacteria bacterium]